MTDEALALLADAYHADPTVDRHTNTIIDLIRDDAHQHSTRPCATCRKITAMIGRPFWCIRAALSQARQ